MRIIDVRAMPPDLALWRRLGALNDPDGGRIAISARPGIRRGSWLGQDLLRALGARSDVSGVGRNADEDWAWVPAWIRAHRIREIVVLHAEILRPRLLDPILLLAAQLDLTLWLLSEGLNDEQVAHRDAWTHESPAWADLAWPWTAAPRRELPAEAPFPAIPDADFVRFRAAARRMLAPDAFARVDALFGGELQRALGWAGEAEPLTRERCQRQLASLLVRRRTLPEMTTGLRAMQAALFRAGWLLKADLSQLLNITDAVGTTTAAQPWRALRAYRQPWRGAACALAGAGLTIEEMRALRLDDVASDGARVRVGDAEMAIDPEAVVFLRAQRHLRLDDAAVGTDLFLVHADRVLRDRSIVRALADAARETGVVLVSRRVSRRSATSRCWIARDGFSLQELRP